LHCN